MFTKTNLTNPAITGFQVAPGIAAVGNQQGKVAFSESYQDDQSHIVESGGINVDMGTIDAFNIQHVDLLKVDVEGFEKFVFEGAIKTLSNTDCVLFESYEKQYNSHGYSLNDIRNFLLTKEHRVYRFCPIKKEIYSIKQDYVSEKCENLVAIKSIDQFCKRSKYKFLDIQL